MDKVGILVVSKCLSSPALVDTFMRSEKYRPEFYVAEKQANPFNLERARVHQVIPDLNVDAIAKFAGRYKKQIAFGLTDTEDFVTAGGRDILERETGIQMLCVTSKYAIERSKAEQRLLFEEICPEVNPRYKIFDPAEHRGDLTAAIAGFRKTAQEFGAIVIKPDAPARGAGVGVWGSDFRTEEQMIDFFRGAYSKGRVVVEEKIEGEESSFQAFSDSRHLFVAPQSRDYKRALDEDGGKLTGGMGSYRDSKDYLRFLTHAEWEHVVRLEQEAFERWKGSGPNTGLRGIVLYDALMHTGHGFKILERNSRGGNTEQITFLTTMQDDFVDVCYRMMDGTLKGIRFANEASVVTCAVPLTYGASESPSGTNKRRIDLKRAHDLEGKYDGKLRFFPMDVRIEDGNTYIGTSRSVAVTGIGKSIEDARVVSMAGVAAIRGPLRHRDDIASKSDIQGSSDHLDSLRIS